MTVGSASAFRIDFSLKFDMKLYDVSTFIHSTHTVFAVNREIVSPLVCHVTAVTVKLSASIRVISRTAFDRVRLTI